MFGRGESNIFCCVDLPFMALTSASRSLLTTGFGVFAGKGCKPSRQLLAWHPRFGQAPRRTNSSPRGKARVYFRRRIPAITSPLTMPVRDRLVNLGLPTSRSSQSHLNQSIAKATNSREPFPGDGAGTWMVKFGGALHGQSEL